MTAPRPERQRRSPGEIPARAGVGLKPAHYRTILESRPDIGFFEVHAENYMGAGGPPHRYLTEIRNRYSLSLHGVGLSIGADRPLDKDHLRRLAGLVRRYEPGLFSEHLAWSSHGTTFFNDLLPLPYTTETLQCVCTHIHQVQESLGRQMLLENPSTYVAFVESTYSEVEFIAEVAQRILVMVGVIQLTQPSAWSTFHLPWAALALSIIALGPGPLSLDHVIALWSRRRGRDSDICVPLYESRADR